MRGLSKGITVALIGVAGVLIFWNSKSNSVRVVSPSSRMALPSVTNSVAAAPIVENKVSPQPKLNSQDLTLYQTFLEIRDSKNDNDPRLDQDLKNLSPELHQALIDTYNQEAPEKRNERGLIVFLISRDAKSLADLQFLNSVYKEEPCTSLENCSVPHAVDPHLGGIEESTLNYPQLAGLFQLERRLMTKEGADLLKDPSNIAQMQKILSDAESFPSSAVQARAQNIRQRLGL